MPRRRTITDPCVRSCGDSRVRGAWLVLVAAYSQSRKYLKLTWPGFCLAVPPAQVDDVLAASPVSFPRI
jgi:hypothetical protein